MYPVIISFGLLSYLVFFLGLGGKVENWLILPLVIFIFTIFLRLSFHFKKIWCDFLKDRGGFSWIWPLGLFFLLGQIAVNAAALFLPEVSFDALWYHLTLPKLYLQEGKVQFFSGGLFYYSAMPQAMEMVYLLGLKFGGQILARSLHFLFGILSLVVTLQLARRFLSPVWAFLAGLIFYSQLTVSWLSSAAYVDLTRTFLELAALNLWLTWYDKKDDRNLFLTGCIIGLASSVKLLSMLTGITFLGMILVAGERKIKPVLLFLAGFLLVLAPWLIYGWLSTKTLLYPFLTAWFWQSQTVGLGIKGWFLSRDLFQFLQAVLATAFTKGDILSPVFAIGLPLLIWKRNFLRTQEIFLLGVYVAVNFLVWFLMPINYNRFLLPYTPAIIVLILIALQGYSKTVKTIFIFVSFLTIFLHLGVRTVVSYGNWKPLLGGEKWQEYLDRRLTDSTGAFWDKSGILASTDPQGEKILVVGGHNLFYVPVAFDHYSWEKKELQYRYVVTDDVLLPNQYRHFQLVFADKARDINIYSEKKDSR